MIKNKLTDRLLLVLVALILSGFIVLFTAFIRPRFSEDWQKFIFASLAYLVVLIAVSFTAEQLKRLSKVKIMLFQIGFYILTVGMSFLIFWSGLLPLPQGSLMYILPITVLSVASLIVIDYLKERSDFFNSHHRR